MFVNVTCRSPPWPCRGRGPVLRPRWRRGRSTRPARRPTASSARAAAGSCRCGSGSAPGCGGPCLQRKVKSSGGSTRQAGVCARVDPPDLRVAGQDLHDVMAARACSQQCKCCRLLNDVSLDITFNISRNPMFYFLSQRNSQHTA